MFISRCQMRSILGQVWCRWASGTSSSVSSLRLRWLGPAPSWWGPGHQRHQVQCHHPSSLVSPCLDTSIGDFHFIGDRNYSDNGLNADCRGWVTKEWNCILWLVTSFQFTSARSFTHIYLPTSDLKVYWLFQIISDLNISSILNLDFFFFLRTNKIEI